MQNAGLIRLFLILATGALIMFIAFIGARILVPLVIAVFLAFLITTLKDLICGVPKVGKFLPSWIGYGVAFLFIAATFFLLVQIVRTNVNALIGDAPAYQARLFELLENVRGLAPSIGLDENLWADFRENIRIAPVLTELASPLRALAANLLTIFLYTGFLLFEHGATAKKIAALTTTEEKNTAVNTLIDDIASRVRQYVSIKTFTSLLTAVLSYGVLLLLGVDYASFWAVLIFVLNYIPIVGSIVAVAFPVALTIVQFGDLQKFALSLVALTGVQQLVGSIIEPRLFGASLNLSPLVILLSLATWGSVWGIAGMLLCIPIMVVLMIVLAQFEATRGVAILMSANGQIGNPAHRRIVLHMS